MHRTVRARQQRGDVEIAGPVPRRVTRVVLLGDAQVSRIISRGGWRIWPGSPRRGRASRLAPRDGIRARSIAPRFVQLRDATRESIARRAAGARRVGAPGARGEKARRLCASFLFSRRRSSRGEAEVRRDAGGRRRRSARAREHPRRVALTGDARSSLSDLRAPRLWSRRRESFFKRKRRSLGAKTVLIWRFKFLRCTNWLSLSAYALRSWARKDDSLFLTTKQAKSTNVAG